MMRSMSMTFLLPSVGSRVLLGPLANATTTVWPGKGGLIGRGGWRGLKKGWVGVSEYVDEVIYCFLPQ